MGLTSTAKVERHHPDADERRGGITVDGWLVTTKWSSEHVAIDRTDGVGYRFGPKHRKLAERLAAAINAGVVFTRPSIKRDVNGNTYVTSDYGVSGRRANADLKRLGF